jgi:hypothetical protein
MLRFSDELVVYTDPEFLNFFEFFISSAKDADLGVN